MHSPLLRFHALIPYRYEFVNFLKNPAKSIDFYLRS